MSCLDDIRTIVNSIEQQSHCASARFQNEINVPTSSLTDKERETLDYLRIIED